MSYRGQVRNGVIILEGNIRLPEGTVVDVNQAATQSVVTVDAGWARELLEIAGTATGLPVDLALNHDHYLYGTKKR
jgi:hypothetical protein